MSTIPSPQNSTNGRPRSLKWLAPAFHAFPDLSARLLAGPFLTPRGRLRPVDPAGSREKFVLDAPGGQVSAHLFGEGPLSILVHGWAGGGSQLEPLRDRLVQAGQSVILFDAPAHGGASGRRTNAGEVAQLVQTLARHAGPVRALIGHSLGGLAAALANARTVRASKLVLLAPLPSFEFALDQYQALFGFPDPVREALAQRVERMAGATRTEARIDEALISETQTLLVHDASDRSIPVSSSRDLAEGRGELTYLETQGLGHKRILTSRQVLEQVVRFVTELEASG